MGWRRAHDEQRVAPTWVWLVLVAVMLYGTVHFGRAAWALATTSSDDCPTVVDTDSGRDVDYRCSPNGSLSKDTAVLQLAVAGLFFGGGTLYATASLVRRRRTSGAEEEEVDALIADLAELNDLHERQLLTDEELDAARTRRLRQDR